MLVDVDGVDDVAHMSLAQRVDDLRTAFAQLAARTGANTMLTQEFRRALRRLDIETQVIKAPYQRQRILLVLVGDREEDRTVVGENIIIFIKKNSSSSSRGCE